MQARFFTLLHYYLFTLLPFYLFATGSVADTAATVVAHTAGDGDVGQVQD